MIPCEFCKNEIYEYKVYDGLFAHLCSVLSNTEIVCDTEREFLILYIPGHKEYCQIIYLSDNDWEEDFSKPRIIAKVEFVDNHYYIEEIINIDIPLIDYVKELLLFE